LVQEHEKFVKEYLAVLPAPPKASEGRLCDFIFHDKRVNKAFITDKARKGSKEASLSYRVLETREDGRTLVLVRLHTGRTHQVRVQFASRGLPLAGDGKYGSREKCPYIGLWACRLSFLHPITGKQISAVALPDEDTAPWSDFEIKSFMQN
jgi:23S rRNA pseudouridine1911/1915/1917 synthase